MNRFITICLLAAVLLFAAACSRNDNAAVASVGRYVEQDITPPIDGPFMSFLTYDGSLVVYSQDLLTKHTSTDGGETWIESPGPGSMGDPLSVTAGALLPDGRLLAFIQDEGLWAISEDGSRERFPVAQIDNPLADGMHVMVQFLEVLGENRLLISHTSMDMGNHTRWDNAQEDEDGEEEQEARHFVMGSGFSQGTTLHDISTGAQIADLPIQGTAAGAVASGNYFYLLENFGAESTIRRFDLADGASVSGSEINLGVGNAGMLMRGFSINSVLTVNAAGELLVMHEDNMLHIVDSEITTKLDGTAFSFGAPNIAPASIIPLPDGSIIMSVMVNHMYNRLYRIYWDANATINAERTITVWSLENNDLVRAAITELRRVYPDSYITYEIALSAGGGVSASDAIRTLNTQLLSGRGPDVLILDGMAVENYIGRGMLLDLSGYINVSDIYPNLLASYTLPGGEIYALPMQQLIPAMAGVNIDQIQTLENLVTRTLAGSPPPQMDDRIFGGLPEEERPELHFDTLQELAYIMWRANLPAIIVDNQLDSSALRQHLMAVQALSDKFELGTPPDMDGMMGVVMVGSTGGRGSMITGSLMRYMMQSSNIAVFPIEHLMVLQMVAGRGNEDTEVVPFPGLVSGVWQPSTIAGVSADSENARFAKQLVNMMLSIEVQQLNHGEGLPITRAGVAAQIDQINQMQLEHDMPTIDLDIDALISRLTTPAAVERALYEIIFETVERLCYGAIDLEGAVREIEQNIRNYLAERG